MGRAKLPIGLIEDRSKRLLTYQKRKAGLLKKLHSLCTLCGVDAAIFINSPSNKLSHFSPDSKTLEVIARYKAISPEDKHISYLESVEVDQQIASKIAAREEVESNRPTEFTPSVEIQEDGRPIMPTQPQNTSSRAYPIQATMIQQNQFGYDSQGTCLSNQATMIQHNQFGCGSQAIGLSNQAIMIQQNQFGCGSQATGLSNQATGESSSESQATGLSYQSTMIMQNQSGYESQADVSNQRTQRLYNTQGVIVQENQPDYFLQGILSDVIQENELRRGRQVRGLLNQGTDSESQVPAYPEGVRDARKDDT